MGDEAACTPYVTEQINFDLVFPYTSPHDVGDRSRDETEMDVNLNPAMEAKDVSVSGRVQTAFTVLVYSFAYTSKKKN